MNMQSLELKIPPAILMLLFGSIMWLSAQALPELAYHTPEKKLWMRLVGGMGCLLIVSGIISFRLAKTTVDPTHPENATTVVQSGIYRFSRNPMYLGFFMFLVAWSIGLSHPAPWLFLPLFVFYMNHFQIKPEEQALTKHFGDPYTKYLNKVRRWI